MSNDTPQDRVDFQDRVMGMALDAVHTALETSQAKPSEFKHESWLIGIFCLCATGLAIYGTISGIEWIVFVGSLTGINAINRTVKKVQDVKNGGR